MTTPPFVADPDPGWPAAAARLVTELHAALPGQLAPIEHIGSTAVPGLPAKPVIDLMAATPDLAAFGSVAETRLAALGYRRLDTGMTGRLFYRREPLATPASYATHLHVVPADSWETRNERILRDHLLAHPADAERYGALKRRLAAAGGGPDAYTRGKTALVQELMDRARIARGLPIVDVWET